MPAVVVTGASGFLGRAVVAELLNRGCDVVTANRDPRATAPAGARGVALHELRSFKGQICIHLAGANGIADVSTAARERESSKRLAVEVLEAEFSHIVFVSSAAVYGEASAELRTEDSVLAPSTLYAEIKRDLEPLFLPVHTVARIANLYGSGMSPGNVFSDIIRQVPTGRIVMRNLTAVRDYLFVRDAAAALADLAVAQESGPFNVSTGRGTSVSTLVQILAAALGCHDCTIEALNPGPPPSFTILDSSLIRRTTGWRAATCLEDGLKLIAESSK